MMRAEGMSGGRDIGVVFNLPNRDGPVPAAGLRRRRHAVHAGDRLGAGAASIAHAVLQRPGAWPVASPSRTAAKPRRRPTASGRRSTSRPPSACRLLCISSRTTATASRCPPTRQTPGGNIAANLAAFGNLRILSGEGSDPIRRRGADRDGRRLPSAQATARSCCGCACRASPGTRARTPRPTRVPDEIASERARDPLLALRRRLVPGQD